MALDTKKLQSEAIEQIAEAKDLQKLRDLEVYWLGRKSEIALFLRTVKDLPREQQATLGQQANAVRRAISQAIGQRRGILERDAFAASAAKDRIDITEPATPFRRGHLHPVTIVQNQVEEVFKRMGYMVLDGPEVESEYHNFDALNIPKDHPARDMQDTFWLDNGLVMRTHTSAYQVRALQKYGAPLKAVIPGRVFRHEATDATHESTFQQMEGLVVAENLSLSNLIAAMKALLSKIFEKQVVIRVRPGYFAFTEPSLEIDVACQVCGGEGCKTCKGGGWLEMIGSGMVHPSVLRAGGIDPQKYTGYAFGLGLTRLVMSKYGIDDIRHLAGSDIRFLRQF